MGGKKAINKTLGKLIVLNGRGYTVQQRILARVYVNNLRDMIMSDGEVPQITKIAANAAAGYSTTGPDPDSKGMMNAMAVELHPVIEELEKAGATNKKLADKIVELLDNSEDWKAVNAGIGHLAKIRGAYAPKHVKTESTHKMEFDISNSSADYKAFLKSRARSLDFQDTIPGEEIDEDKD